MYTELFSFYVLLLEAEILDCTTGKSSVNPPRRRTRLTDLLYTPHPMPHPSTRDTPDPVRALPVCDKASHALPRCGDYMYNCTALNCITLTRDRLYSCTEFYSNQWCGTIYKPAAAYLS